MPANGAFALLPGLPEPGSHLEGFEFAEQVRDPTRRAYVAAYALTGFKTRAARAVGVSMTLPWSDAWKADKAFQAAMREADLIIADKMVDEAKRRGVEGMQRFRFTKSGDAIPHPTECECGHGLAEHPRLDDQTAPRACAAPGCVGGAGGKPCPRFSGVPYFEHEYSDRLLETLLKGELPEKYGQKVELKGALATMDVTRLPDHALERIRRGENIAQVLGTMAEAGVAGLLPPGDAGGVEEL